MTCRRNGSRSSRRTPTGIVFRPKNSRPSGTSLGGKSSVLSGRRMPSRAATELAARLVVMRREEGMNLPQLLETLRNDPAFMKNVTRWEVLPPRPARYGGFPAGLDGRLVEALKRRGIHDLYIHQTQAVEAALAGRSTVVVTPTASGKTMCYNLPVLNEILRNPSARALYLFPTKALSQDQLAELKELSTELD